MHTSEFGVPILQQTGNNRCPFLAPPQRGAEHRALEIVGTSRDWNALAHHHAAAWVHVVPKQARNAIVGEVSVLD